jgi:hypothetical protein
MADMPESEDMIDAALAVGALWDMADDYRKDTMRHYWPSMGEALDRLVAEAVKLDG